MAARATLHCLTGCAIGEVLGLVIGTALGLSTGATIALAIALAFVFGYALTLTPGAALRGRPQGGARGDAGRRHRLDHRHGGRRQLASCSSSPARWTPGSAPRCSGAPWRFSLAVAFVLTVPVNRWLIARGRGHAVVHGLH